MFPALVHGRQSNRLRGWEPIAIASLALAWITLCAAPWAAAQAWRGEIHVRVQDPNGHPMAASVVLSSEANHVHHSSQTGLEGTDFRELPFGVYRLLVQAEGFSDYTELIEVRTAYPLERQVALKVQPERTSVPVTDRATLLDPGQTGAVYHVGSEDLETAPEASPGRAVINMVLQQPGWLAEANGVLHPRGSEYDTQVVVDGQPMFDNRSPAFAPGMDDDDVQSLNILTSNFPAEYGRKLGGVVEVVTRPSQDEGLHGSGSLAGGSYRSVGGSLGLGYAWQRNAVSFRFSDERTDRYLDPPVEANYTNQGSVLGTTVDFDHDFSARDRVSMGLRYGDGAFLVPNELSQQESGQLQKRNTGEISGRIAWQHVFSPALLGSVQARGRDLEADLRSNPASIPLIPLQDRGFREGYAQAVLAGQRGQHDWKVGADVIFGTPHERFSYQITEPSVFDPSTPANFHFAAHGHDNEQSWFAQDLWKLGKLAISAGLRWDHYNVIVDETGWSPRVGAAYSIDKLGLIIRGSYDRIFQTPAIENLLLASSPEARMLNGESAYLPVRPARGNYYDVGVAKGFGGVVTWNASYFRREISNFSDDDLLLNTGVSFPIAFQHGTVYGIESKVEIAHWGPVAGYLGYSYMLGRARLPVTGGLFLGDDTSLLNQTNTIPISQDQRNTASARLRYQVIERLWIAAGASYGSGLPVELDQPVDEATLIAQYGANVVSKINFDVGRVRPSAAIDLSAGYELWKHEARSVRVQGDLLNVGNRLNVINFAGVFSGTALAPRRNFALRLEATF